MVNNRRCSAVVDSSGVLCRGRISPRILGFYWLLLRTYFGSDRVLYTLAFTNLDIPSISPGLSSLLSMTSTDLHLRESTSSSPSNPKVKKVPERKKISLPFSYIPSDDGTDENLLILLHGLGDTHLPFTNLGRQLKLPQTAVLALRAPEQCVLHSSHIPV